MSEKPNNILKRLVLTFILYFISYNGINCLIIKVFDNFFDYETFYGLFYGSIIVIPLLALFLYIINRIFNINNYMIIIVAIILLEIITFFISGISYTYTIIKGLINNTQGITLKGILLYMNYYTSFILSYLLINRLVK